MKKSRIFLTVFFLIFLSPFLISLFIKPTSPIDAWRKILGEPEYKKVRLDKPLLSQTRIISLGKRRFQIPLMYIDGQMREKGEKQRAINLKFIWPDFKTMFQLKNKEEYDVLWKQQKVGYMLVQDAGIRPTISKSVENLKKSGAMSYHAGKEFGLEKYSNPEASDGYRRDDMYLEIKNGNVISFIQCSAEGYARFPGCSHEFYNNGIRYEISYNKKNYLESWKERQADAIKFVDEFEIQSGGK